MSRVTDSVVVGGGLIGASIAYHLAGQGVRVTLLDQGRFGSGASDAAAGMLTPVCEAGAPDVMFELGWKALKAFPAFAGQLEEETGLSVEMSAPGLLRVAADEQEARALQERIPWQRAAGCQVEWLEAIEVWRLEPLVNRTVAGAVLSSAERQLHAPGLLTALIRGVRMRGGRLLPYTPALHLLTQHDRVTGVATPQGPLYADAVILAAGAWTGLLSWAHAPMNGGGKGIFQRAKGFSGGRHTEEDAQAQERIWENPFLRRITPRLGQIVSLAGPPHPLRRVLFGDGVYVVPKRDGSVMIGATEEDAGFDSRVTARGVREVLARALALAPALAEATFQRGLAGLRPMTLDHRPILDAVRGWERLYVAAGHHRKGVLLAAVTGELMTGLVLDGNASELGPFAMDRIHAAPRASPT